MRTRWSISALLARRSVCCAALAGLCLCPASPACAQDDGARLYMMVPDQTTIASVRFHLLHSNVASDDSTVNEDNDLDTRLLVFQFVQTLRFGSDQGFIFTVIPASRIGANDVTDGLTGFGDAQLGFVFGVHGTPALAPADYANYRPGLAVNLLAKLFFPTASIAPPARSTSARTAGRCGSECRSSMRWGNGWRTRTSPAPARFSPAPHAPRVPHPIEHQTPHACAAEHKP